MAHTLALITTSLLAIVLGFAYAHMGHNAKDRYTQIGRYTQAIIMGILAFLVFIAAAIS